MKEMSRTATTVWMLPLVKKVFISVDEECLKKCVTGALAPVHNYYVARALHDAHVSLQGSSPSHEGYGEEE